MAIASILNEAIILGINTMRWKTRLLLIAALAVSLAAQAEVYTWRDSQGKMHFSDQKPTNIDYVKKEIVVKSEGARFATPEDIALGKKKMRENTRSNHYAASIRQQRKTRKKRLAHVKAAVDARRKIQQQQHDYLQEERAAVRAERERYRRAAQHGY